MIRIILHGAYGRMGRMITDIVSRDENTMITAGVDALVSAAPETAAGILTSYPVYATLDEVTEEADVVIDFSNAAAADGLIAWCRKNKMPVVLCTTGLTAEQTAALQDAAKDIPVLKSANMSIGINLLLGVLRQIAPTLAEAGFDIEVMEKHHNQKLDAPSGTALALADAINDGLEAAEEDRYEYVYDRSGRRMKRPKKEIGISAIRGGTIVGDHDVIFAGEDEVITLTHRAYSRAVFAKGAVTAAKFLAGKEPGFYGMEDALFG